MSSYLLLWQRNPQVGKKRGYKLFTVLTICELHISFKNHTFQPLIQLPRCLTIPHHDFLKSNDWQWVILRLKSNDCAWSCREVTKCTFFMLSLVICCVVHIAFVINQNWYIYFLHIPLKISSFIKFDMLNGNSGGGVGEGVCYGGGGGGGVDGWVTCGKPCLIN